MIHDLTTQLIALATGVLLLTAVLQLSLRSIRSGIRLLVVQGIALGALIVALGLIHAEPELIAVGVLTGALKGGVLPWALQRTARGTLTDDLDAGARPAASLLLSVLLTTVAYVVAQPLVAASSAVGARAVPVGLALVLLGFLMLMSRHAAVSQLVGFLILDNGIATTAFLTSGGLPVTTEIGVLIDVLLVVLILRVLTVRLRDVTGDTSLAELSELRD